MVYFTAYLLVKYSPQRRAVAPQLLREQQSARQFINHTQDCAPQGGNEGRYQKACILT